MIDPTPIRPDVLPLTPAQKAALAPFRQAVAAAQAALSQAFGLLVTGAGVDLATHTAELSDDGAAVTVRPRTGTEG